jgi:hypothetical protein
MKNVTLGKRDTSETGTVEAVADHNQTTAHIYPTHGTQKSRLLAAMLAGRRINPLTAWREFGIYRLSDAVHQLKRKNGWPIQTEDYPVTNTFSEECVVGLYSLMTEVIAEAGSEAQQFVADEREVLRSMRRAA